MKRFALSGLWILGLTTSSVSTWAATQYDYVAIPGSSTLSGGPVVVDIYLKESNVGTFSIAGDGSLYGAAFRVTRNPGGSSAKITGIANYAGNFPEYNAELSTVSVGQAVLATEGTFDGVIPTAGLLRLGSVTIDADTGIGNTTFTVDSASFGNLVTLQGHDLDRSGTEYVPIMDYTAAIPTTFAISVPEPGSIALALTAGLLCLRRSRRQDWRHSS